jgi:WD40 repeat protein
MLQSYRFAFTHGANSILRSGLRSEDNTLKIWTLGKKKSCIHTIVGHESMVFCCKVFDQNRQFVSGASDSTLKGWVIAS